MYATRKSIEHKYPINVGAYLERESIIRNTHARVEPNGKVYRVIDNVLIPEKEFLKMHPPVTLVKTKFNKGGLIGRGIER